MAVHRLEPVIAILISNYERGDSTNTLAHELENQLLALAFKKNEDVCICQRFMARKEPGRHHPACDLNPAYRLGDWS